jgi:hypothetical protein
MDELEIKLSRYNSLKLKAELSGLEKYFKIKGFTAK